MLLTLTRPLPRIHRPVVRWAAPLLLAALLIAVVVLSAAALLMLGGASGSGAPGAPDLARSFA